MGASNCCPGERCELPPDFKKVSPQVLKERFEGHKRLVKNTPEVWVTITGLTLPEDFKKDTPLGDNFRLEVQLSATVTLTGSNRLIIQEIGSEAALKLLDKVGGIRNSSSGLPSAQNELTGGGLSGSPKRRSEGSQEPLIKIKEKKDDSEFVGRVNSGPAAWETGTESKTYDVQVFTTFSRERENGEVRVVLDTPFETKIKERIVRFQSEGVQKHVTDVLVEKASEILGVAGVATRKDSA